MKPLPRAITLHPEDHSIESVIEDFLEKQKDELDKNIKLFYLLK